MSQLGALTPINRDQLKLGQALPRAVFDAWGNTLHEAGVVISDPGELKLIFEDGYFEDALEDKNHQGQAPLPKPSQASSFSQPASKFDPKTDTKLDPILASGINASNNLNNTSDLNKESVMLDLDSVRWQVGETFFLQVHDNAAIRYTVRLIGFVKNQSILVTAPRIDGRGAIVRDGQTFIVRAFPGKKAYAFTASALKSVYTPHPYLHLSYPKIVRCTAIRQSSRAIVKIIASLSIGGGIDDSNGSPEQTGAATLTDISMGGTSGILKRSIGKKGDAGVIKFKVNTAGEDVFLVIPVTIRSIAQIDNVEEFRYGFEFINIPTQSKIILSSFVHQTLAEIE